MMDRTPVAQKLIEHLIEVYDLVTELDLIQSTSPLNLLRQDYCDTINTIVGLLRQEGFDETELDNLRDELEYNQVARKFNSYMTRRALERNAAYA